jgi:hypothetical protein
MNGAANNVARNLCQMRMVGEEKHLGRSGQFGEHFKPCARPIVVEIDEQVVRQERQPHA